MNAVVHKDTAATLPASPVSIDSPTPMQMLQIAVSQNADIDKLSKLMELEERWRASKAKEAFVRAMNAFKAEPAKVLRNKTAIIPGKYSYTYAPLVQVVDAVCANLSKHGLSYRWETTQKDKEISVTCVLTHELGHSERVTLSAYPDDSGGKNSIQAVGSTVSYLQRYTLMAATGLAASDQDDDAKLGAAKPRDDDPALEPWRKKLSEAGAVSALEAVWREMGAPNRKRLAVEKDEAKKRIQEAERVAAEAA